MIPLLLVTLPAAAGLLALLWESPAVGPALLLAVGGAHLGGTLLLWGGIGVPPPGRDRFLALDPPGLLFLTTTSLLFALVALHLSRDLRRRTSPPPRWFLPCLLWFLAAMTLVTVSQHLGLLWAAVEATTLASAPLVDVERKPGALEAAWKYLLLCSVGIALALLGTFFLGMAASGGPLAQGPLTLPALLAEAPRLAHPWVRAAFVLALVGYGTKMGLVPLHTWLPDTHSQAPAPVSALLSGALLNCAFLGIFRFLQVARATGDAAFAPGLLALFGLASIVVAAAFMLGQTDYKRLLAYSSIENMGIVAVGVGLGGGGVYGGLLHAVNHSLTKGGLFLLAGNVLGEYGTTEARGVSGLLGRLPATGILLTLLFLAVGGTPPFAPFLSELAVFRSALSAGTPWGVLYALALAVAFLGLAGVFLPMLQGKAPPPLPGRREGVPAVVAPLMLLAGVVLLGLSVPPFLADLLHRAAASIGG